MASPLCTTPYTAKLSTGLLKGVRCAPWQQHYFRKEGLPQCLVLVKPHDLEVRSPSLMRDNSAEKSNLA